MIENITHYNITFQHNQIALNAFQFHSILNRNQHNYTQTLSFNNAGIYPVVPANERDLKLRSSLSALEHNLIFSQSKIFNNKKIHNIMRHCAGCREEWDLWGP